MSWRLMAKSAAHSMDMPVSVSAPRTGQPRTAITSGVAEKWCTRCTVVLEMVGAVNDSRAFQRYLLDPRGKQGLGVPPPPPPPRSNIAVLEDEQAACANILATFRSHFLDNPRISDHGDSTMILSYAGEGRHAYSRRITGASRMARSRLSALSTRGQNTLGGAASMYVDVIPDYILGWLLRELEAQKGLNIVRAVSSVSRSLLIRTTSKTLILDCSHAGGMERELGTSRRVAPLSPHVPLELASHLRRGKPAPALAQGGWAEGAISHVLLGGRDSTRDQEHGRSDGPRARFTEALIFQLRRTTTTYSELLTLPEWGGGGGGSIRAAALPGATGQWSWMGTSR
ncbi:hypothetical protein FB451DRAFT_1366240 [Mycena latifolia]|nr:hypothetical protein FB451DRAFT_1366240 [Mycena latifolia]